MNRQFVTFEIAKKLSELNFDEPCLGLFKIHNENKITNQLVPVGQSEYCSFRSEKSPENKTKDWDRFWVLAPIWQQVKEWLSETHKIYIEIRFADKALTQYEFFVFRTFEEEVHQVVDNIKIGDDRLTYPTFKEAREQAILKAIELIGGQTK